MRAIRLGFVLVAASECATSAGYAAPGREQMMAGSGAHDSGIGFKGKKTRW
jgi:hypothetical protein